VAAGVVLQSVLQCDAVRGYCAPPFHSRTTEGRERAKANGVKMGRPSKLTPHQKKEAIKRRDDAEETLAEIGRSYNVSGWTISRLGV
jgi:DNA invertase Pin-like site-specific DNA recombinase